MAWWGVLLGALALAVEEDDGVARPIPDIERLFPDSNLQFPSVSGAGKSSYIETFDQMFPMRVECWCERYDTGLYKSQCADLVRQTYRWYYAHGVSTLKPQDVWLVDAKHYWAKEEECEYTHPYDLEAAREKCRNTAPPPDGPGCDVNGYYKPEHIKYCKEPVTGGASREGRSITRQCYWDLQWAKEDPAYKLGLLGYQCRRCPLYLGIRKKNEVMKDRMSFNELSLGVPAA